jgi:hypothetical protein
MTAKLAIPPGHRISGEDEGGNVKASVKRDHTVRTIYIDVEGAEDLDVTQTWQRRPRVIRPDHVEVRVEDGERQHIRVSGPLVLKSGGTSDSVRDSWEWNESRYSGNRNHLAYAPEWVRTLWNEAHHGVATWWTPDTSDPAEVQAL